MDFTHSSAVTVAHIARARRDHGRCRRLIVQPVAASTRPVYSLRSDTGVVAAGSDRACFDSLGDLNFMEELLIVVWTISRIDCWIIGG